MVHGRWTLGNRIHLVRDEVFLEDKSMVRTGDTPRLTTEPGHQPLEDQTATATLHYHWIPAPFQTIEISCRSFTPRTVFSKRVSYDVAQIIPN